LVRDAQAIAEPFQEWPHLIALVSKIIAKAREGGGAASEAVASMC
jgi:hypothetical protein